MMPRLLPPQQRATNRRRWSFRFSGLTTMTVIAVGAWNATPDAWHPSLPEWGKYAVTGIAIALALLANASHLFAQSSLQQHGDSNHRATGGPTTQEAPCTTDGS